MILTLLFTAAIAASISILWRKMLNDLPQAKRWIENSIPYPFSRAIVCGFCFTYWISLASIIVLSPLREWDIPLRFSFLASMESPIHFFATWMITGLLAATLRFLFVVIQELVDYEMYTMNARFHPLSSDQKEHRH